MNTLNITNKKEVFITRNYLRSHLNEIFVYGDNTLHRGTMGAAALSTEPNSYGFVTKKYPRGDNDAFYKASQYREVYKKELKKLKEKIEANADKVYLISKLGAGLANRFRIFNKVIEPSIKEDLKSYSNVRFLW